MKNNIAFLLGAGASFPYGIPMMRQFYTTFLEHITRRRRHCLLLVEQLMKGTIHPDLEILIQKTEQVRNLRNGLESLSIRDQGLEEKIARADELRGYIDSYLIETCEQFNRYKVENEFAKLVQLAKTHNAAIFTTNYDRLVEVAGSAHDIVCSDGFEHGNSKPESLWNGDFSSGVKLIKLHGSVNWYEEEGTASLFRLERGYSLPSSEYRLSHGARALRPLMIIPTLEKSIIDKPYIGLLTQFSDALKELDILFVIGNSLRDTHLRHTISERAQGIQIVLINPAAADQMEIAGSPATTHSLAIGTEEFIAHALPTLENLLSECNSNQVRISKQHVAQFVSEIARVAHDSQSLSSEARENVESLRSKNIDLIRSVLGEISQTSDPSLIEETKKLLLGDADESIKVPAISALIAARGSDAAEILARVINSHESFTLRAEAALALRTLDGGAADEALKRLQESITTGDALYPILSGPARAL